MIDHKRIRMKAPHHLQGWVFHKHLGEDYVLDLGGGVTVGIKKGDYCRTNGHMAQDWLEENPELWEPA